VRRALILLLPLFGLAIWGVVGSAANPASEFEAGALRIKRAKPQLAELEQPEATVPQPSSTELPSSTPDAACCPSPQPKTIAAVPDAGTPVAIGAGGSEAAVPGALAVETPDAGARPARDPRFVIRWDHPGLCLGQDRETVDGKRAHLLASFQPARSDGWHMRRDLEVSDATLIRVADALTRAKATAAALLGPRALSVEPPAIYVYRDVEQLLQFSCVNRAARGYYDGAIHLDGSWEPDQSAAHEYFHHVLNQLGVKKPMWFHEGLAIFGAGETWWNNPRLNLREWLAQSPFPFEALTEAFPHAADEKFAVAVYYQSVMMVLFLQKRSPDFRAITEALSGGADPFKVFETFSGLEGAALARSFKDFAAAQ
jgi:hypothetical protein